MQAKKAVDGALKYIWVLSIKIQTSKRIERKENMVKVLKCHIRCTSTQFDKCKDYLRGNP